MRKAMKRQLGREKQAKNLADSIESGLLAQGKAKSQREHEEQQALIARHAKDKKKTHISATSKIAQEKKARVDKRLDDLHQIELAEKERLDNIYLDDLAYTRPNWDLGITPKDPMELEFEIQTEIDSAEKKAVFERTFGKDDHVINLLETLFGPLDGKA